MSRRLVANASADSLTNMGGAGAASSARLLVPERVVITTELDPFLPLRALAAYADLSGYTLRQYLDLPPDQALPDAVLGAVDPVGEGGGALEPDDCERPAASPGVSPATGRSIAKCRSARWRIVGGG